MTEVTRANLEHALLYVHWQHLQKKAITSTNTMIAEQLTSMTEDVTETVTVAGELLEVIIINDIL